jgi:hypothetical protein
MALLTNNAREWEPLWRAMAPVAEIRAAPSLGADQLSEPSRSQR